MSMRARLSLVLSMLVLGGCFGSHSVDEDAGPPLPDGGVWVDCYTALWSGREGQACSFDESCGEITCGDEGGRELLCLGGQLRFVERICTIAAWDRCETYLAGGGHPGDACNLESFGDCSRPAGEPCCQRQITCDPTYRLVIDEVSCTDGCVPPELCEDYAPPPPEHPTCRSASECSGGFPCVPVGTPPGCGICLPTVRECEGRFSCEPGYVCVEEPTPCGCEPELSSFCRPVCSEDGCLEGERCGDVCEPIPCSEGFGCPPNTYCPGPDEDPAGPVDAHGCARIGCAIDADCECGVCIDGLCQSGPGICQPPAP